jgi:hypothetical protein
MMKGNLINREDIESLLLLAKSLKSDGQDAMSQQFQKKKYSTIMRLNLLMNAVFCLKDL